MSKELITKKDYQILGVKENSSPNQIMDAYEKVVLECCPETIRKNQNREPNQTELEKYREIEATYQRFIDNALAVPAMKWFCCSTKKDNKDLPCGNQVHPIVWKKGDECFCSRDCYNRGPLTVESISEERKKQELEWLNDMKRSTIKDIEKELEIAQVKREDLELGNRNFEQEINSITEWKGIVEKISPIVNRMNKDIWSKSKKNWKNQKGENCDICGKEIERYEESPGMIVSRGVFSVDSDGNHHKYCSRECSEKGRKNYPVVTRKNIFAEIFKWMKQERITNFSLDPQSEKLTIEFNNSQTKTLEDNNLTAEQKKIKEFLKENKLDSLNQKEVEGMIDKEKQGGNKNSGSVLTIIIVVGVIALIIGVVAGIIFQKKKSTQ